jgi:hypothetical protein
MNDSLLIEKHLADGLTDEEAAQLEAAVSGDAGVAGRLVAAARMDQRLAVRLGPGRSELACLAALKRGRTTASDGIGRWRRPLAMAAALVLVLGLAAAVAAWRRSMGAASADGVTADSPRTTRPFVPAPVPVTPDRADAPPRVETETPAMASLRRFLSSYYLTDLKLETARPLEEALERLLQRARELNHLKNPVIERLSAELAAAEPGDARPDTAVALPLKHLSLMDALHWVAALNRSEVFLKEPGVITFRPWEPTDDETLVTEVVRVRPDLLTRPVAREDKSGVAEESGAAGAGIDPFVGSTEAPAVPRLTPIELFQSWGISFGGQASASYDEATAAMTIRHTASALRAVRELVELGSNHPLVMINVFTKILEFPGARSIKDELLTDGQFQVWLGEMNQTKGVNLLSAPQITIRSGQRGMIEIADTYEPEGDWRGLRLPVEAILEGEVVKVVGAVELRLPVNRQPGQLLIPHDLAASELVTTGTDFEVIVPPGQTAVFSANESPEGPHFAIAVTVVPVDPSGQRAGAPVEEPVEAAVPEETGEGGDDVR